MKYLLLIATSIMLIACNTTPISTATYMVKLNPSGELKLPLDKSSKFSPFTIQYLLDNDKQYLLTTNSFKKSIDVYDLDKVLLHKRIFINDSIREYQQNLQGFWAIGADTILTYSQFKLGYTLLVLDNFEVKNRSTVMINNPETGNAVFNHASMTVSPSAVVGGSIYFSELPMADISKLVTTDYSPEIVYDIKSQKVRTSGIYWPEVYQNGRWGDLFLFTKTYDNQNRIIYSWQASPDLMVNEHDSIYTIKASSDFFERPIQYDPSLVNAEGRDKNYIVQNQYMAVLYDQFRKVYYRYAIHGIPEDLGNGYEAQVFDKPFSIIILDESFKKIGETLFEGGQYLPKDSFIGKEGLYISKHNRRQYEELGEDQMVFELMKLRINE